MDPLAVDEVQKIFGGGKGMAVVELGRGGEGMGRGGEEWGWGGRGVKGGGRHFRALDNLK